VSASPAVLLPVALSVVEVAPVSSPESVLVSAAVCLQEAALASLVPLVPKVPAAL